MPYDPKVHRRRSIRLRGYDYSRPSAYFITICTHEKQPSFGEVAEGEMHLNEAGELVCRAWADLPRRLPGVVLDEFVVMPNHVHGIIQFVGAGLALPDLNDHTNRAQFGTPDLNADTKQGTASSAPTLGNVVRAFKSISAIAVNALLDRSEKPLWQRNYYEHIVRNPRELKAMRDYIRTNPARWATDPENILL